MPNKKGQS